MTKDLDFQVGDNAAGRLLGLVQRIERVEEEIAALSSDKKEVYAEAKGDGFDTKTIRKLIRLRAMDPEDRKAQQEMLELYAEACGE